MLLNETLTIAGIREYVRNKFGVSFIDVELLDVDIDIAAQQTLRVLNRYIPNVANATLNYSQSVHRYEIVQEGLSGILDVSFLRSPGLSEFGGTFDDYINQTSTPGALGGGSTYSDYIAILQQREMAREVTSVEPEWDVSWELGDVLGIPKRLCILYISAGSDITNVSYRYTWHTQYIDGENRGLSWVRPNEHDWFLSNVLNEVRPVLVRILDKFGGIMNPSGGSDNTDASTIQAMYESEKDRLLAVIKARATPILPVIG